MASLASGTRRAIGIDEWVDHTHATTYEAFVAAVEVVAKNTWGLAGQGTAPPSLQSMGREVDLTEVVKYDDVMWSLTLHCDNRSSSYDDHGGDGDNNQANTVQWKDPSLRHLTPTMLSLWKHRKQSLSQIYLTSATAYSGFLGIRTLSC